MEGQKDQREERRSDVVFVRCCCRDYSDDSHPKVPVYVMKA